MLEEFELLVQTEPSTYATVMDKRLKYLSSKVEQDFSFVLAWRHFVPNCSCVEMVVMGEEFVSVPVQVRIRRVPIVPRATRQTTVLLRMPLRLPRLPLLLLSQLDLPHHQRHKHSIRRKIRTCFLPSLPRVQVYKSQQLLVSKCRRV